MTGSDRCFEKSIWRKHEVFYESCLGPPGTDCHEMSVHPGRTAEGSGDPHRGRVNGVERHHDERHHEVREEHGEQEQVELCGGGGSSSSVHHSSV